MSTDDDDLRINTLHRFAKHSARLILHEYSHCEVPAGCGGVVLRWIDPAQGRPARTDLVAPGTRTDVWLDGASLASSRFVLQAGRRLVALHLVRETAWPRPFVFGLPYDARDALDLISRGQPVWRATATRPAGDWMMPAFDDAAWPALAPVPPEARVVSDRKWEASQIELAAARNQPVFQFDTDELWVRVAFEAPT